jgi:thiol-disulfide isomerase/thioredoxin
MVREERVEDRTECVGVHGDTAFPIWAGECFESIVGFPQKLCRDGEVDGSRVLLKKVFVVDALECPDCAGAMTLIALIAEETTARRILEHLGLDAAPPPLARAQAPPEHFDSAPDYDVPDPAP